MRLNRVSFSGKSADGFSSSRGLASSARAGSCPGFFTDSKQVSGKVCSMKARNSNKSFSESCPIRQNSSSPEYFARRISNVSAV